MVIGHIYRALGGGGMQRGTGVILKVHHDMGHKVVLFTRLPPGKDDYKISVPYEQIVIGGGEVSKPATPERLRLLREGLLRTKCDLVIHHEYFGVAVTEDLRVIAELGIPVLVQWHSCFTALHFPPIGPVACCPCLTSSVDTPTVFSRCRGWTRSSLSHRGLRRFTSPIRTPIALSVFPSMEKDTRLSGLAVSQKGNSPFMPFGSWPRSLNVFRMPI